MKENNSIIPKDLSNLLQKKYIGKDFANAKTIQKEDFKKQFQLFEVMIGETISAIFDDFSWYTSSVQGDRGIDFYGEKNARELPFSWKKPPLIIYGQVKYRTGAIRKSEIESATKAIIDYHRESSLQKKSLYEIIHVIKSSQLIDISYGETINISNIDTRHYTLNIINAEDFFKIWVLNKKFLKNILPNSLSQADYHTITSFLKTTKFCWSDLFDTKISVETTQSIERVFNCNVSFKNKILVPTDIIIKLMPPNQNVFNIVEPVHLISPNGLKIKVYNNYTLHIHFLPLALGQASLGTLQIFDADFNLLHSEELGSINVDSKFNPTYFSVPNNKINGNIKKELINTEDNILLYSIIGEGGIGKSSFVKDITIFGVNHGYRAINYEHICNYTDDKFVLVDLFLSIVDGDKFVLSPLETKLQMVKKFFGAYYNDEWEQQLYSFMDEGCYTNLGVIIDCWICALLLASDKQPLIIHLSNLHWSSPNLIIFLTSLVKTLQNKREYFNHKVFIGFEGRTSEIIFDEYKKHIPYEWILFTQNGYTQNIRLEKWTDEDSRIYISNLFSHENFSDFQKRNENKLIDEIIMHSTGNPMHINELIKHLIDINCLALSEKGKLRVLNSETRQIISDTLLDTINLRISYFALKYKEVIDFIILYLNVEECDKYNVSNAIINELEKSYDINNLFREMGFVSRKGLNITIIHEHYKIAIKDYKVSSNNNIHSLLHLISENSFSLSSISINRLNLMEEKPDYKNIAQNIIKNLNEENNAHDKYSMLTLLCQIPDKILDEVGFPKYHLLNNLQEASTALGDWNMAIEYIKQIKSMKRRTYDYILTRAKAQLALSNIYGIKLNLDMAITEAEDAIKNFEFFLSKRTAKFHENKNFQFSRVLIFLYNRLAIEYYMSGQRKKAETIDLKAKKLAHLYSDVYSENHIKYERGVRLLHKNPILAKKEIQEANTNINLPNSFLNRHEKDLINADFLMAELMCANHNDSSCIERIYNESRALCDELNTFQEPFESVLVHTICAITCILRKDYNNALKCFFIAVTIAEKTSLDSFIWKSYLNIAQLYVLLGVETNYMNYKNDAVFYASEAKKILELGVLKNPELVFYIKKVLKHPLNIANSIIYETSLKSTEKDKKNCSLYINYDSYYFFLLD